MNEAIQKMLSKGYTAEEADAQIAAWKNLAEAGDPVYNGILSIEGADNVEAALAAFYSTKIDALPAKGSAPAGDAYSPLGAGALQPTSTAGKSKGKTSSSKYAAPTIEDANVRNAIDASLAELRAKKKAKTAKTSIARVLTKLPDPSTYLSVGGEPRQVVISTKKEKLDEYAAALERNPENEAAYKTVRAAADAGTPVPVFYDDKNNRRIVGVVVDTVDDDNKKTQVKMSISRLEAFLLGETAGIITNGESYVQLAKWDRKVTTSADNRVSERIVLQIQWVKKGIFWDKGLVDSVAQPVSAADASAKGMTSNFDPRSVKIQPTFKIVENRQSADGKATTVTRTIRLGGKCTEFPLFELKPEYADTGITLGRQASFVASNLSDADVARYDAACHEMLKMIANGQNSEAITGLASVSPAAASIVSRIRAAASQGASVASDM